LNLGRNNRGIKVTTISQIPNSSGKYFIRAWPKLRFNSKKKPAYDNKFPSIKPIPCQNISHCIPGNRKISNIHFFQSKDF